MRDANTSCNDNIVLEKNRGLGIRDDESDDPQDSSFFNRNDQLSLRFTGI